MYTLYKLQGGQDMSFEIKRKFSEPVMECLIGGVNLWIEYDTYNNPTGKLDVFIQPMNLWKEAINIAENCEVQLVCDEIAERYIELECDLTKETIAAGFYAFYGVEVTKTYLDFDVTKGRYEEMEKLVKFAKEKGGALKLISFDDLRKKIANIIVVGFADGLKALLPFTVDFFEVQFDNELFYTATYLIEQNMGIFFEFIDNKFDGYDKLLNKMGCLGRMCSQSYFDIENDLKAVENLDEVRNGAYSKYLNGRLVRRVSGITSWVGRLRRKYQDFEADKVKGYKEKEKNLNAQIDDIDNNLKAVRTEKEKKESELIDEINVLVSKSKSIFMMFKKEEKNGLLEKIKHLEKKKEELASKYNKQLDELNAKRDKLSDKKEYWKSKYWYLVSYMPVCSWDELYEPI